MGPTGIYCCDIPGSDGNLCVGGYDLGTGYSGKTKTADIKLEIIIAVLQV